MKRARPGEAVGDGEAVPPDETEPGNRERATSNPSSD